MTMQTIQQHGVGPTVPHHTYLGGSDIGAVLGLSPYKTQLDVWAAKTGRGPVFDNARTKSGNRFERTILENYTEDTGAVLTFPGTLRHPKLPTGSTPDAIANGARDVQVKMVGFQEMKRWGAEQMGEDGIPAEVLAQIHFEWLHVREVLGVSDSLIHVAAQFGTEPRTYEIRADRAFAEDMLEAGLRFWRDHVVADRMPVVVANDGDTLRYLYKRAGANTLPMTDHVETLARAYAEQRAIESQAKKAKDAIGVQLMDAVRDDLGYAGRGVKVTWREQRGHADWERIARERGATDADAEAIRRDAHRVLDVRLKGGE